MYPIVQCESRVVFYKIFVGWFILIKKKLLYFLKNVLGKNKTFSLFFRKINEQNSFFIFLLQK